MFLQARSCAHTRAPYFSDLLGADVQLHSGRTLEVPLTPAFEHAILVLNGDCSIDGQVLQPRMLYYLGTMRSAAAFASRDGARLLLIGGPPFPEKILMWWNFVARTQEEIAQARTEPVAIRATKSGQLNIHGGLPCARSSLPCSPLRYFSSLLVPRRKRPRSRPISTPRCLLTQPRSSILT